MARGFRLSGDNALAALKQSMRSRMREDEARHRTQFAPSEPRSVAGHSDCSNAPTLARRAATSPSHEGVGRAGEGAPITTDADHKRGVSSRSGFVAVPESPPSTINASLREPEATTGIPSARASPNRAGEAPINGAKADSSTQPTVSPRESRSGAIGERATAASSSTITVPWPITGNTAVRHGNGSHYLRKEVLDYRRQVAELCIGAKRIVGPYRLRVVFSPPDKRQRDMDNALKSLLDALVPAGFLPSDSMTYMRELYACVVDKRAGIVQVTAEAV